MKYLGALLVAGLCACAGCGLKDMPEQPLIKDKPPVINFNPAPALQDAPRYEYAGDRTRDPFHPLSLDGSSAGPVGDVVVPSVGSLILKGIMADEKQKIAIIIGGGISYVLKGKYLYDNRQRLVSGITGVIKDQSVIIIAPDKTTKELRLREK